MTGWRFDEFDRFDDELYQDEVQLRHLHKAARDRFVLARYLNPSYRAAGTMGDNGGSGYS